MIALLQNALDAISVGSLYALAALGIGLIFGVFRLINFAHGELIMIGAYTLMCLSGTYFPIAVIGCVVVVVFVALGMDRFIFRPIRGANAGSLLMVSFAVSYLFQNLAVVIFGARPLGLDLLPQLGNQLVIGDVRASWLDVVIVIVTFLLMLGVACFLRFTRTGVEMRAAAVDFRMARLLGVRANRVIGMAFALSATLAAVTSVLLEAQTGTLSPTMGLRLALIGFVATVIGGMGSLVGAVLGGFVVGAISVGLQAVLPLDWRPYREALVFIIVIVVLLVRPQGMFVGAAARERV
jgi:branched-chain amino acid transport system permease protein